MTEQPLVTVICLCYNQAPWLEEAVASVFNQTYKNLEVILVDDGSTDNSVSVIQQLLEKYPTINVILSPVNNGNCKAFNDAYVISHGDFIIDLAADDVMMPQRIEKQVNFFKGLEESYGVVFTDAIYIDAQGKFLRNHFEHLLNKGFIKLIPQGDLYKELVASYIIASPTMMIRRNVFDMLEGYDPALAYEDFDFWVRSSRHFKYGFLNEKLTKIRKSKSSMSTSLYTQGDKQLYTTYLVCKKIMNLNRTHEDKLALIRRVQYELRHAALSDNYAEATLFYNLLKELKAVRIEDKVLNYLNKFRVPMSWFRNFIKLIRDVSQ